MVRVVALVFLMLSFPLWLLIGTLIKLTSRGPVIFRQKRVGKNQKIFTIYKFRTMVENAEQLKGSFKHLNEADGPIFKIYNDPRYAGFGRLIAHTYLDELPQLLNIIRGEMAFVGPRPLLPSDVVSLPKKYASRFSILPGVTSPWVVKGKYKLTFREWMKLDVEYASCKSLSQDAKIILLTLLLLLSSPNR